MPAKDIFHDCVKRALVKDGWTITHDPYRLKWDGTRLAVDLGAQKIIAAEKDATKIAVEVKSFAGQSEIREIQQAVGQIIMYQTVIETTDRTRLLYLAMPDEIAQRFFNKPNGRQLLVRAQLRIIGFDPQTEEIVSWMS